MNNSLAILVYALPRALKDDNFDIFHLVKAIIMMGIFFEIKRDDAINVCIKRSK